MPTIPTSRTFIDWKVIEEQKVANLVTGSKINQRHLRAILKACVNCEGSGDDCFDPEKNPVLRREIKAARRNHVPDNYIRRVIQFAKQGYNDIHFPIYDTDWDSEAYLTVSGQNSNNTVRVTDEFLKAVEADRDWDLFWRTKPRQDRQDREGARSVGEDRPRRLGERRSRPAIPHHHQRLAHLRGIGADPRLQSVLGIHVPRRHGLQSRLAEPAAFHTPAFPPRQRRRAQERAYDVEGYEHAVRLWTIVLEISVLMAQFPSREIAQRSYDFRTLGLGYANVGGLLMSSGIPYDSEAGRAICAALSAIMTGVCYATSAEMAAELGPFPRFAENRERDAAGDAQSSPRRLWRAHRL